MALTTIGNRLTPSVPTQITYGSQPLGVGTKITTLFAHKLAGAPAADFSVYSVVNVGVPAAARAEVEALAGVGSQAALMAQAFVASNAYAGRANFPAFRIVFLPATETSFGPNSEAFTAIQSMRSDMLVSCYPASDSANRTKLQNFKTLISGIDRNLLGQFGSFMMVGSIDALAAQVLFQPNDRGELIASLPDTNTALVTQSGVLTSGSNVISGLASTAGIYPGAEIAGTGVPAGAVVGQVTSSTVTMVDVNDEALPAAASEASAPLTFQNVVSQAPEIVAAAQAALLMSIGQPYNPVQGMTCGGIVPPQKASDHIMIDPNGSSEQALKAGLSPMYCQPGGQVGMIRSITTYDLLPDGVTAATTYIDFQQIVPLFDFREELYQASQQPPFNNNPGGSKASAQMAAKFNDQAIRIAAAFEVAGMFQNTADLAKQFQTQVSATGRFDGQYPVNVVNGLFVIAINIVALS